MFGKLRDPRGRYGLLMSGVACLALAGWLAAAVGRPAALAALVLAAAGLSCCFSWWRRRREERYDLRRLWDEPLPATDEPYQDTLDPSAADTPYCGWCDEAYPPGTSRCVHCGRALG